MSKIYEKNALILRKRVGEATGADGIVYELATSGDASMLIKSGKTGRTFRLDWQTAIQMAVDAGINEEPKP